MSHILELNLCFEPAPAAWGASAKLSFSQHQAFIHLEQDSPQLLDSIQQAGRKLDSQGLKQLRMVGDGWNADRAWAFYQGYYNAKQDNHLDIAVLGQADLLQFGRWQKCIDWTRKTINLGPADIYPESLCKSAAELISSLAPQQVTYQIITGEALLEQGMIGCYHVGKGSERVPAMLQLDYNPTGDDAAVAKVALVGKGITFDSGGYSLKPSDGMSVMKSDMGGAATVAGALALAIANGLQQRVKLFLCCAENLVSGSAYKLGDVLNYPNGVSVEVLNTDAEGRLVLADGLIAASKTQAEFIIDAATLTGAAKVALGRDYNAVLAFDQDLVSNALAAAKCEQERAWPLPLESFHLGQIGTSFADIANIHSGEGMAGASTAAAFLSKFVAEPQQGWLHMDLAGAYQKSANGRWATGAKGHGVRTIANLVNNLC